MFLKRSLVLMAGILLFIGFFLLKFHYTDAGIEKRFAQQRIAYGVEGTVLTSPESAPPPPAPAPAVESAAAMTPASTPPAPSDSASTSAPSADSSPSAVPAGSITPDSNVIIGPVPPSGTSMPDDSTNLSSPIPPSVTPSPDTNGGPMTPPPTTMNGRRESPSLSAFAASRPVQRALHLMELEAAQVSNNSPANPPPVQAAVTNPVPTVPAANAAEPSTRPATAAGINQAPSSVTAGKSVEAPHAVSAGGKAIILGFHQFTGPGVPSKNIYSMSQDVFAGEMKYLHDNGYNVVPLSDVVRFVKHEIGLPPNAVAITIDDGYKSAINYAAPVLKQYNYPWTFFVYPQFITRTESKGATCLSSRRRASMWSPIP
jgi:hypothetical protein